MALKSRGSPFTFNIEEIGLGKCRKYCVVGVVLNEFRFQPGPFVQERTHLICLLTELLSTC